jgi:plasmid stabilization system protein ParE
MSFIGHSGRIEGTREFVHHWMPYIVVYHVKPDAVEILHIHHSAQNWPRA